MKFPKHLVALMGVWLLTSASAKGIAQWDVFEQSFQSRKVYANPFTAIEVDVVFQQGEKQWVVPAFWAGGGQWTVRFAPPAPGDYHYRVQCTDPTNRDLNGNGKTLRVAPSRGPNPLLKHGFLQVSADRRHFAHADGTPFFWLGDTWWKGLCQRLTWDGFRELAADRKAKGFSVVQIVCGSYPDEGPFDSRWGNEGGNPYETRDYSQVNLAYFKYADRRIRFLVDTGLVPAIVGGWARSDCDGMKVTGIAGLKRHWRNLVARYGAYPTVWIVAGEADDEKIPRSTASARAKWGEGPWGEVAKYLREIDPYHHPVTFHTTYGRRGLSGDVAVIDFDMVTGSHDGWNAASATSLSFLTDAIAKQPPMPVLSGETAYEGHMQNNFQDIQRHVFWMLMLSGAAGHTYGAAGVWNVGVEGEPGTTPVYDLTTWQEGMQYPGSTQLGLGKKLLEEYPWSRFEPHPEWGEPGSYSAGIPGEVRFVYQPRRSVYNWAGPLVKNLERNWSFHAFYFNPTNGRKFDLGTFVCVGSPPKPLESQTPAVPARQGSSGTKPVVVWSDDFKAPELPSPQDWVLVLERAMAMAMPRDGN
jgi:hypothetical protein